jgi:putative oxidoreductase
VDLQRLFSTFANGWPGLGLLLQRLLSASALFFDGIRYFGEAPHPNPPVLRLIGAGTGIFVLAGLWTPVTGMLVAIIELCIAFSHTGDPWISILLATLGATLAMTGPGAWSIDAQLFGRKHFAD